MKRLHLRIRESGKDLSRACFDLTESLPTQIVRLDLYSPGDPELLPYRIAAGSAQTIQHRLLDLQLLRLSAQK